MRTYVQQTSLQRQTSLQSSFLPGLRQQLLHNASTEELSDRKPHDRTILGRRSSNSPMPNGIVFRTMHGCESRYLIKIDEYALWSVVIITDCAASARGPNRPAARATISKAALFAFQKSIHAEQASRPTGVTHHSVPTIRIPGIASFRNVRQLLHSKTRRRWMPPQVLL